MHKKESRCLNATMVTDFFVELKNLQVMHAMKLLYTHVICFRAQPLGRAQNKLELNTHKYICFIMINTKFMHQSDKKGTIYFTFHFTCISIYVLWCFRMS